MEAGIKQRYNTLQRASISAKCKQLFGGFSMGLFVSVNLSNAGQCLPFKMAILAPTRSTTGDDSVAKGVVRTWTGQTRTILNSSAAVGRDQPKNYVMFWAKPPKRSSDRSTASVLRRSGHNLVGWGSSPNLCHWFGRLWVSHTLSLPLGWLASFNTRSGHPGSVAQGNFLGFMEVVGSNRGTRFSAPFLVQLS